MLAGPHAAGATVAGEDLVDDQEDVVRLRELTQLPEVSGIVGAHAGDALEDGLDDDGGDRAVVAHDELAHRLEGARVGAGLGEGGPHALEEHARERPPEDLDAAQARRSERVAVIRTVERDEARLLRRPEVLPRLERDLHRHLDGGRAVVGVEYT